MMHILIVKKDVLTAGGTGSTTRIMQLINAIRLWSYDASIIASGAGRVNKNEKKEKSIHIFRTIRKGYFPNIVEKISVLKPIWLLVSKLSGPEWHYFNATVGWGLRADYKICVDKAIKERGSIDVVWGICAGTLDGALLALRISEHLRVPFIYELHDPPVHAGIYKEYAIVRAMHEYLLSRSNKIIVNTRSYYQELCNNYPAYRTKISLLIQPVDDIVAIPILPIQKSINKQFFIRHIGSITKDRDLAPILYAIKRLLEEQPSEGESVLFELYGPKDGVGRLRRIARKIGVSSCIRYCGFLGKNEIKTIIMQSDINVIVQGGIASKFEVPGKLFEYLQSNAPIIGIMSECETSEIIEQSGCGRVFPLTDIKGIADYIGYCVSISKSSAKPIYRNEEYIMSFFFSKFASDIKDLINSLTVKELTK